MGRVARGWVCGREGTKKRKLDGPGRILMSKNTLSLWVKKNSYPPLDGSGSSGWSLASVGGACWGPPGAPSTGFRGSVRGDGRPPEPTPFQGRPEGEGGPPPPRAGWRGGGPPLPGLAGGGEGPPAKGGSPASTPRPWDPGTGPRGELPGGYRGGEAPAPRSPPTYRERGVSFGGRSPSGPRPWELPPRWDSQDSGARG